MTATGAPPASADRRRRRRGFDFGRGPLLASPRGQRRLVRRREGSLLGGVATGLAQHLGIPRVAVRAAFVVLAGFGGAGVLIYALLWIVVPEAAPDDAGGHPSRAQDAIQVVGLVALGLAVLLIAGELGFGAGGVVWPLVVGGLGVALVWSQPEGWRGVTAYGARVVGHRRIGTLARTLVGLVLLVGGLAGFLAAQGQLRNARTGLLSTVVVVVGLALLSGPWWLRTAGELTAERRARIRAQERAEIAAHVHDSVLHTLALIQRNAGDARTVGRLARSQERELRAWLYRPEDSTDPGLTLVAALEAVAAEVEDAHGVSIDLVAVGDAVLDERLRAVVAATREAVVNAAKASGADTVSVYAEAEPTRVTVFVRDRGCGFELEAVPADRHGISGSIIGRMQRAGGTATVRTAPGDGTEVELVLAREPS